MCVSPSCTDAYLSGIPGAALSLLRHDMRVVSVRGGNDRLRNLLLYRGAMSAVNSTAIFSDWGIPVGDVPETCLSFLWLGGYI